MEVVIAAAIALAAVAAGLLLRRRYSGPHAAPRAPDGARVVPSDVPQPGQTSAAEANTIWESRREVQRLVEHVPELRVLYATLGYSPAFERQATQLVHELMALINVDIPDFATFTSAVHSVQAQLETPPAGTNMPMLLLQERIRTAHADPLWQAVLAAGQDQTQVLALLNRNPVYEQLPFLEQVPLYKDGQVIWRTPVEVSVLRKRPGDVERFARLLDALATPFVTPCVLLNAQARQEVADEIARVRRDLQRQTGYLPTALQALAQKVSRCLQEPPHTAVRAKREALDHFLAACVTVRRAYSWDTSQGHPLDAASLAHFKATAQQHAQYYLHTVWMHLPWLTTYLLTNLLDSELVAFSGEAGHATTSLATPAGRLALIRAEVASGHYDCDETMRRLRQQEEQGLYVHSLVYPLLRLQRTLITPLLSMPRPG